MSAAVAGRSAARRCAAAARAASPGVTRQGTQPHQLPAHSQQRHFCAPSRPALAAAATSFTGAVNTGSPAARAAPAASEAEADGAAEAAGAPAPPAAPAGEPTPAEAPAAPAAPPAPATAPAAGGPAPRPLQLGALEKDFSADWQGKVSAAASDQAARSHEAAGLICGQAQAHAALAAELCSRVGTTAKPQPPAPPPPAPAPPAAAEEGAPPAAPPPFEPAVQLDEVGPRAGLQLPHESVRELERGLSDDPLSDLQLARAAEALAREASAPPEGSPLREAPPEAAAQRRHPEALAAIVGYCEFANKYAPRTLSDVNGELAETDERLREAARRLESLERQRREALGDDEDLEKAAEAMHHAGAQLWDIAQLKLQRSSIALESRGRTDAEAAEQLQAVERAVGAAMSDCAGLAARLAADAERLQRAVGAADAERSAALAAADRETKSQQDRLKRNISEQDSVLRQIAALYAHLAKLTAEHTDICHNLEKGQKWKEVVSAAHGKFLQERKRYEELLQSLAARLAELGDVYEDALEHAQKREINRESERKRYNTEVSRLAIREMESYWQTYCEWYASCGELLQAKERFETEAAAEIAECEARLQSARASMDPTAHAGRQRIQELEEARKHAQELTAELRAQMRLEHADQKQRELHQMVESELRRLGELEDPEQTLRDAQSRALAEAMDAAPKQKPEARPGRAQGPPPPATSAVEFVDPRPVNGGRVQFWVSDSTKWFGKDKQVQYAKDGQTRPPFTEVRVVRKPGASRGAEPYDIMYLVFPEMPAHGFEGQVQLPRDGARRTIILWKVRRLMERCGLRSQDLIDACKDFPRPSAEALSLVDLKHSEGEQAAAEAVPDAPKAVRSPPPEPEAEKDAAPAAAAPAAPATGKTALSHGARAARFALAAAAAGAAAPTAGALVTAAAMPPLQLSASAAAASFVAAPVCAVICGAESGAMRLLRLMAAGGLTAVLVPYMITPGEGMFELAVQQHVPDLQQAAKFALAFHQQHAPLCIVGGAAAGAVFGPVAMYSTGGLLLVFGLCAATGSVAALDPGSQEQVRTALRRGGPLEAAQTALRCAVSRSA